MSRAEIRPQDHPTGPSVPGYELLREVGHGPTGVVYLARQLLYGRNVALKRINDETLGGAHDLTAFCAGGRAAARLEHANIATVYEAGDAAGEPYLASEFVEGESLRQRLGAAALPAREAARLVETLARAVHYAHTKEVLHGHLSPANVLLEGGRPRITDYGLAVFLHGGRPGHPFPGDPGYAAPEQAGEVPGTLSPAADVYGLGAILYALLTGRPPLRGDGREETLRLVRSRPPLPPGLLHPGLPADLETICLRCLAKQPSRRYPTAQDLAEDLRRFQEGRPIESRPVAVLRRVGRWCRHHPAMAAACLVLVLALALTARGYRQAALGRDDAEAQIRHSLQREQEARSLRDEKSQVLSQAEEKLGKVEVARRAAAEEREEARKQLAKQTQARQDAERAYRGETHARATADERARAAEEAQRQATARGTEVARQLAGMHAAAAIRALQARDPAGSLPWLTGALRLARAEGSPEDAHRLRLAAVLGQCPRPVQLWYHEKGVNIVRFSPDGRRVWTVGNDTRVVQWDVATGKAGDPLRHEPAVLDVVLSADGKRMLTADADHAVHGWDLETGKELFEAVPHAGAVLGMAFRPGSSQVLTVSFKSAQEPTEVEAHLWDPAAGEPPMATFGSQLAPGPAEFSPDGKHVLTVCHDRCARVWDAASGNQVGASLEHGGAVRRASFSPDGKQVVTASADGTARVWETTTGKAVGRPLRHGAPVVEASFSRGGRYVLTRGEDMVVRVWEAATGERVGRDLSSGEPITAATFSPDGRHVLFADEGGAVRVHDAVTGEEVVPPLRHGAAVRYAVFDPAGRGVLTSDGRVVRLWDLTAGEPVPPAVPPTRGLTFSADGRRAGRLGDQTATVLDAHTGKPVGTPCKHEQKVLSAALSADGRRLLTVCPDGEGADVTIWDPETGKKIGDVLDHVRPVTGASFSADGKQVLTVCGDRNVRVWDAATGKVVGRPMDHKVDLVRALFHPDGKRVLSLDVEGTVRTWEAASGNQLGRAFGHNQAVLHIGFSPDGARAVTTGDGAARVWDLATGEAVGPWLRHSAAVLHAAFSPDGKRLATASADRTARVWDAESGAPAPPLRHREVVTLAAFSADGRWLITAAGNRVRLWDTATGEPISPPLVQAHPGQTIHDASFDRTGKLVTAAGEPGDPAGRWERTVRADDRPLAALEHLAVVLAGRRADPGGLLTAADPHELASAWQALKDKAAADFTPAPERVRAWDQRAVRECAARGLPVPVGR
jgi:WD40 repeat protein